MRVEEVGTTEKLNPYAENEEDKVKSYKLYEFMYWEEDKEGGKCEFSLAENFTRCKTGMEWEYSDKGESHSRSTKQVSPEMEAA